jgi:hypothetical protein
MAIKTGGNVHVSTGNVVMDTAGKGIDFSATADGTGTTVSELFDDYEEGTWTPTLQDSTQSDAEGQTYSSNTGYYTKIGDTVHWKCYIEPTSLGTLTSSLRVAHFPFTSNNSSVAYGTLHCGYANSLLITAGETVTGYMQNNAVYALLQLWDGTGGTTGLSVTEMTDNGALMLSGSYHV